MAVLLSVFSVGNSEMIKNKAKIFELIFCVKWEALFWHSVNANKFLRGQTFC